MQASNSDDGSPEPVPWLELPDPCLLAVLHCCATDPRTLFSAARAHSRLRVASTMVLDGVHAVIREQQQLDSLQMYQSKHGQHVAGISLVWSMDPRFDLSTIHELPANLPRLRSVSFEWFDLQLQPGNGHRGVLPAAVAPHLTRLELRSCELLDGEQALAAALTHLPGLQHLSTYDSYFTEGFQSSNSLAAQGPVCKLQQLTFLELSGAQAIVALTALTRLADLRLALGRVTVTASMLPDAPHLTRLQLRGELMSADPAILAGRTQLQHLELGGQLAPDHPTGAAELLRQLQQLQQLTKLVFNNYQTPGPDSPPAAAYSALTASSNLQAFETYCTLPEGVWQHMFPAGRQLPQLRVLDARGVRGPTQFASVPECSRLVSCCPGLRFLGVGDFLPDADIMALVELTGLRELKIFAARSAYGGDTVEERLLQLTCLVQLTRLQYFFDSFFDDMHAPGMVTLRTQTPRDAPVRCQLLQRLANSTHAEVAQQAAAQLAGLGWQLSHRQDGHHTEYLLIVFAGPDLTLFA